MVVDVGEAGEGDGEVGADQRPQLRHVGLGGDVLALVLGLGVDEQAVGAVPDRLGAHLGLEQGVVAVHVLPGADAQAGGVQGGDERRG